MRVVALKILEKYTKKIILCAHCYNVKCNCKLPNGNSINAVNEQIFKTRLKNNLLNDKTNTKPFKAECKSNSLNSVKIVDTKNLTINAEFPQFKTNNLFQKILADNTSKTLEASFAPKTTAFYNFLPKHLDENRVRIWDALHDNKFGNVVILLLALLCYIVLGSWIFQRFEGPHAIQNLKKFAQLSHARHIRYYQTFRELFRNEHCAQGHLMSFPTRSTNISRENLLKCNNAIRKLLESYDEEIFFLADLPYSVVGESDDESIFIRSDWQWNYWNSAFFALSIITTIGYGNMSCETFAGRLATIIYAIVGIPLMLVVLSNLGKLLFEGVQLINNAVQRKAQVFKNQKRHSANMIQYDKNSMNKNNKNFIISENYLSPKENLFIEFDGFDEYESLFQTFPLYLAMIVVFVYISFCAILICIFEENWDWFTAFYFLFVSLSTIGLGDEMPQYSHYYTIYSFIFLIIGLALVSMCISAMKVRVENQYLAALELLDKTNNQRQQCCNTKKSYRF